MKFSSDGIVLNMVYFGSQVKPPLFFPLLHIWLSAKQIKIKLTMLTLFHPLWMEFVPHLWWMVVYVIRFTWYHVNIISVQYMDFWLQLPIEFLHFALAVSQTYTHITYRIAAKRKKSENNRTQNVFTRTKVNQFLNSKKHTRKKISEMECDE